MIRIYIMRSNLHNNIIISEHTENVLLKIIYNTD